MSGQKLGHYSTVTANLGEFWHHTRILNIFREYYGEIAWSMSEIIWKLRGLSHANSDTPREVCHVSARRVLSIAPFFVRLHARHQSRMLSKHSNALFNTSVHLNHFTVDYVHVSKVALIIIIIGAVILQNV